MAKALLLAGLLIGPAVLMAGQPERLEGLRSPLAGGAPAAAARTAIKAEAEARLQRPPDDAAPRAAGAGEEYGEVGPSSPRAAIERTVVRLNSAPAVQLAAVITQLLGGEREATYMLGQSSSAVVVADPTTNSLVVSGTAAELSALKPLVIELDRPQPMVRIKAVVIEAAWPNGLPPGANDSAQPQVDLYNESQDVVLARLIGQARVDILARPQLMALDNQPALLEVGARVPVGQSDDRGQVTMVQQNVGLKLSATPRVMVDGRIALELALERSQVASAGETLTAKLETTITLRSGQTAVVGRLLRAVPDEPGQLAVVVTADILAGGSPSR